MSIVPNFVDKNPVEESSITVETTLDVRQYPCTQRHALVFQTFASLQPDEAFILVNDHDPKPLYYQFHVEWTDQFQWTYLEQGPQVWQVQISKVSRA